MSPHDPLGHDLKSVRQLRRVARITFAWPIGTPRPSDVAETLLLRNPMNVRRPRSRSYAVIGSAEDIRLDEPALSDVFDGVAGVGALLHRVKCHRYRRRAIAFDQGEPADSMFVVRSGSVLISRISSEGRELSVDFIGERQVFGEEAFFLEARYVTTATCTTDACIYSIDGAALRAAADTSPRLAINIARVVQRRFETLSSLLETIAFNTVSDRIVRLLDRLADRREDDGAGSLSLDLTHGDIATMVGSTRESVSAAIGSLVRHGRLKLHDRRLVVVPPRRRQAAEAS